LATDASLTNERVLTAGAGITITDAGAGSTVTISAQAANLLESFSENSYAYLKAYPTNATFTLLAYLSPSLNGTWTYPGIATATKYGRTVKQTCTSNSGTASIVITNWQAVWNTDGTQTWKYVFLFGLGATINTTKCGVWCGLYSVGGTSGGSFGTSNITDQIIVRSNLTETNWFIATRTGSGTITATNTGIARSASTPYRLTLECDGAGNLDVLFEQLTSALAVSASYSATITTPLPANGTAMLPTFGNSHDSGSSDNIIEFVGLVSSKNTMA
jgi:hypothetical protein